MMELKIVYRIFPNISKLFGIHCQSRCYSRYHQNYVEPLSNIKDIKEFVKSKDPVEIELLSVKAAKTSSTCSVFYDEDVRLMSRYLMRSGNRILAESLIEKAMEHIKRTQVESYHKESSVEKKEKIELDPKKIFHKAVQNCTPVLTTKKIIRSGTTYVIPTVVLPKRAKFLAMKFIIETANEKKKNERFYVHLAKELIAASQNTGNAVQKKTDLHKYCEANRAYAHYRWT